MLTAEQNYILYLLRKSLRVDNPTECVAYGSCAIVADAVIRNGILLTVYHEMTPELKKRLQMQYMTFLSQNVNQDYEGKRILSAFNQAGMDCIALKGWELRKLYPKPQMRQMVDLDILIRPYHYSAVKEAMERLGYQDEGESTWKHDNFVKDSISVEAHKRLSDDSGIIQIWENEMWKRAYLTEKKHVWKMSSEDSAVFHFIHLHKDFQNGSLGLRRIADTWLLIKQNNLNLDTLREILESFGMKRFYDRMTHLCTSVMGETEINEDDEIMLKHAFCYGIYGSDSSYKAGRIVSMSSFGSIWTGKIKSCLAAVFLPFGRMKSQFPVLKKWPALLPICWVKRIVSFLRLGNLKYLRKQLDYSRIGHTEYEEMKAFLKAGGIL